MKPTHQRLRFVLASMLVMAVAALLILRAFQDNLVFFYTPTQWLEQSSIAGADRTRELRIGGLVKQGSLHHTGDATIRFTVTDLTHDIPARYTGLLPSLFREGQGVVAQGTFDANGEFQARTILAKHDENYMPKEVVDQLKESGRWRK